MEVLPDLPGHPGEPINSFGMFLYVWLELLQVVPQQVGLAQGRGVNVKMGSGIRNLQHPVAASRSR